MVAATAGGRPDGASARSTPIGGFVGGSGSARAGDGERDTGKTRRDRGGRGRRQRARQSWCCRVQDGSDARQAARCQGRKWRKSRRMACDTGRGAAQSSAESVAQAGASSKQLTYRETRLSDTASERSSKLADAVHLEITADCFA